MNSNEIKDQYPIRDIIQNRYGLRIRNGFVKCPFHRGDNSASLKVYDSTQTYYCFGCGAGGDIFDFVQRMEGCSFKDAFLLLGGEYEKAQKVNRPLIEHNKRAKQKQKEYEDKQQQKREIERESVLYEIKIYRFIRDNSEPLSDRWCNAVNKLQYLFQKLEGAEVYQE